MSNKRNSRQSSGLSQTRRSTSTAKKAAKANAAPKTESVSLAPDVPAPEKVDKEVIEVPDDGREELNPNSKEWDGLYKEAKAEMGGMPPIHAGPHPSKVSDILRVFDLTAKYGPCAGITRLERWERAKKWGLNPPDEIKTILLTQQGEDDVDLRESVLYGWV